MYLVGFEPESEEYFRNFGPASTASVGRASEAESIYGTVAYTCIINNSITEAISELATYPAISNNLSNKFQGLLAEILGKISDAQVAIHSVYKLAGARYEALCERQGASGIADSDLLEAFIDPPAAYSSIGIIAFQQQQFQAVRSQAQGVGKKTIGYSSSSRGSAMARGGPVPSRRFRRGSTTQFTSVAEGFTKMGRGRGRGANK